MSFRLIPTRSLIRACANLSRPTPAIKTIYRMQYQYVRPTCQNLCYTQSRGIFWGDKKQGQEQGANAGAAEKETNTQTQENVNEAKHKETAAEQETKAEQAETTQKKAETKTTQNQESKPKQEVPEKFETLLENFSPENKKKLQALWAKLEKESSDRSKQIQELKTSVTNLETAANNHKQKSEDLRNRLKEEIEEKEFMRKRFDKELDQAKAYAITKFAKDLIEVPDNLGRALDAAKNLEGKGDNLYDGVKATNSILLKTLARHGITQLSPIGQKFDPNYHEALFDFDDPNQKPGTCGYVANVGYTIGERVLRPAKVGVVKGVYKEEVKEEKNE